MDLWRPGNRLVSSPAGSVLDVLSAKEGTQLECSNGGKLDRASPASGRATTPPAVSQILPAKCGSSMTQRIRLSAEGIPANATNRDSVSFSITDDNYSHPLHDMHHNFTSMEKGGERANPFVPRLFTFPRFLSQGSIFQTRKHRNHYRVFIIFLSMYTPLYKPDTAFV